VLRRSPDRGWRRWGTDRLVRTVLRVVRSYADAHPSAPRVGIGDLSRPHGGDFGPRFGGIGHASHQNGLDVDVFYPRRDGMERAPERIGQIDRRLSQDLVDRFVAAGAARVFVGPHTGLTGPPAIVQPLVHHDNHLHFRLGSTRAREVSVTLGLSYRGRPIRAWRLGTRGSRRTLLVVGCIHGTECAGLAITRQLLRLGRGAATDLWVLPDLNPDGFAAATRQNARGVDLNRNFPSGWRPLGVRSDPQYSGPHPFSERETRIARALILRLRPRITIWFHQPAALVRAYRGSEPIARRYARLAGLPFRVIPWLAGTAPNWQNHRFPGTSSFVVELPPGSLTAAAARRYARAVLRLRP